MQLHIYPKEQFTVPHQPQSHVKQKIKDELFLQYKHLDWQLFLLQNDGGPLKIGVGKFACPHCPQVMKTSQMIWRHILIHTGEKPFACPHCDFRTNRKSNLTAHVKNQHSIHQLDSF